MKYLILLIASFTLSAETVERAFLPFSKANYSFEWVMPQKVEPGNFIVFKISGVDFSHYPKLDIDGANLVYLGSDGMAYQATKEFSKGDSFNVISDSIIVTGDSSWSLDKIQTDSGDTYYNVKEDLFKVIDSLRVSAKDGEVTVLSDADNYIPYYHTLSFDVSDREPVSDNNVIINKPITFESLSGETHLDYIVKISNVYFNGLPIKVESDLLFNTPSNYNTYTVNYGYSIPSNRSWYTFYKIQNNGELKTDVFATVFLSDVGSGKKDIQRFDVRIGELKPLESVNLSGGDLVDLTGADSSKDYHISTTFHTSEPIAVASQNASPTGRTVNLIE